MSMPASPHARFAPGIPVTAPLALVVASSVGTQRVEQLDDLRLVGADAELNAIHQIAEARPDLLGDMVGVADDGESMQDVVVDDRCHGCPFTSLRHGVEFDTELAPAVVVEHRSIGGRGTVERDGAASGIEASLKGLERWAIGERFRSATMCTVANPTATTVIADASTTNQVPRCATCDSGGMTFFRK